MNTNTGDDPRVKVKLEPFEDTGDSMARLYIDNKLIFGIGTTLPLDAVDPDIADLYLVLLGAAYRAGRKAGRSKVQKDIKDALGVYK